MDYSPLKSINVDNWLIRYCELGSGPDILFVHGWASSSRMWQLMMEELAGQYRCVALDLPGFGESSKPGPEWYDIGNYVSLVEHFAAALGLRSPVIAGHSMGGTIAIASVARGEARYSGLAVINPVVTGRTYWDLRLLSDSPLSIPMVKLGHWFWPIAAGDWGGPWSGHERQAHHVRRMNEWRQSTPTSLKWALKAVARADLRPVLNAISVPTLVLLGKHDLTVPNHEGRLAAENIEGAQLVVLKGGHSVTDDLPAQCHQSMADFLKTARIGAPA